MVIRYSSLLFGGRTMGPVVATRFGTTPHNGTGTADVVCGMFVGGQGASGTRAVRDVTDGLSNTIAMGEMIKAKQGANNIKTGAMSIAFAQDHCA